MFSTLSRGRAAAALLASLCGALTTASASSADTATPGHYYVQLCNTSTSSGLPLSGTGGGFTPTVVATNDASWTADQCSSSVGMEGHVGGSSKSPGGGDYAGWTFTAPTGTEISTFDVTWDYFTRGDNGSTQGLVKIAGDVSGTLTSFAAGASQSAAYLGRVGLHDTRVDVLAYCSVTGGGAACPVNTLTSRFYLRFPTINLTDLSAPVPGATSGSARDDSTWAGTKTLNVAATDSGSGVARFRLYVDGTAAIDQVIDSNNGHCAQSTPIIGTWTYNYAQPCLTSVDTTESIDTTQIPDGPHTVTAKVVDASGREATLFTASKTVSNNPPVNTAAPEYDAATHADQAHAGDLLAVKNIGTWTGPGLSYVQGWQQCDNNGTNCVQIPGANAISYSPAEGDIGHRLRFAVTASNAGGSVTAYSPLTSVVSTRQQSADAPIAKTPADGTNGTNGLNGAPGLPGADGAMHTLNGHPVGEAAGSTCPGEKATLVVQHVSGSTVRLRYGKSGSVQLALTCTTTGKAITGAKLEIATRVGAHAAVASDVVTDSEGHAVIALAKGASRSLTVGYRMWADDVLARATATVTVRVTGRVTLKASRRSLHNGQAVTLRGTLAGGNVPRRGVALTVQWKDGKRWRPFAQIKTNVNGAFRYAYKFTRTNRKVSYRLRVQVSKGQVDYPFEATASKAVKVTVAP